MSAAALRLGVPPVAQPAPNVLFVGPDARAWDSLKALIQSHGGTVETSRSAADFIGTERPRAAGCVVLDIGISNDNALEVQGQLVRAGLLPVIVVSDRSDTRMTVRAMKAGAIEFLVRPFTDEVLLDAITEACELSRAAATERAERDVLVACYDSLTQREREVMDLVARGLLNKQVGAELDISEITVKWHRGKVMRKMRARSLADLVRIASRLHQQKSSR